MRELCLPCQYGEVGIACTFPLLILVLCALSYRQICLLCKSRCGLALLISEKSRWIAGLPLINHSVVGFPLPTNVSEKPRRDCGGTISVRNIEINGKFFPVAYRTIPTFPLDEPVFNRLRSLLAPSVSADSRKPLAFPLVAHRAISLPSSGRFV